MRRVLCTRLLCRGLSCLIFPSQVAAPSTRLSSPESEQYSLWNVVLRYFTTEALFPAHLVADQNFQTIYIQHLYQPGFDCQRNGHFAPPGGFKYLHVLLHGISFSYRRTHTHSQEGLTYSDGTTNHTIIITLLTSGEMRHWTNDERGEGVVLPRTFPERNASDNSSTCGTTTTRNQKRPSSAVVQL